MPEEKTGSVPSAEATPDQIKGRIAEIGNMAVSLFQKLDPDLQGRWPQVGKIVGDLKTVLIDAPVDVFPDISKVHIGLSFGIPDLGITAQFTKVNYGNRNGEEAIDMWSEDSHVRFLVGVTGREVRKVSLAIQGRTTSTRILSMESEPDRIRVQETRTYPKS